MSQAGLVMLAMAGLWIAYLVPHRLRFRQQLVESRTEDRFSTGLRVLRAARSGKSERPAVGCAAPGLSPAPRVHLHPAGAAHAQQLLRTPAAPAAHAAQRGSGMERPQATRDRITADAARRSAAEHARRSAELSRRAAAARRRSALTAVTVLAAVAGWIAVALTAAGPAIGVLPTLAFVAVLVEGRRAAVAAARADEHWSAGRAHRLPAQVRRPGTVGRAVHPSEATTQVIMRVPARETTSVRRRAAAATADRAAETVATATATATATAKATATGATTVAVEVQALTPAQAGSARSADNLAQQAAGAVARATLQPSHWAPVPVPRPTYSLKPAAPRGEPAPLPPVDPSRRDVGAGRATAADGSVTPGRADVPAAVDPAEATGGVRRPTHPGAPVVPTTGGLDLDAILARRRASGE